MPASRTRRVARHRGVANGQVAVEAVAGEKQASTECIGAGLVVRDVVTAERHIDPAPIVVGCTADTDRNLLHTTVDCGPLSARSLSGAEEIQFLVEVEGVLLAVVAERLDNRRLLHVDKERRPPTEDAVEGDHVLRPVFVEHLDLCEIVIVRAGEAMFTRTIDALEINFGTIANSNPLPDDRTVVTKLCGNVEHRLAREVLGVQTSDQLDYRSVQKG